MKSFASNANVIQIISAKIVCELLKEKELMIIEEIKTVYERHFKGLTNIPHSVFLKFPNNEKNRIIGLPSYLGGESELAGFKWIASFPDNYKKGLDRASALLILNSMETGYPKAVIESSVISAKRTAASAALASTYLCTNVVTSISLVGCGLIGFEIIRFMMAAHIELKTIYIHDLDDKKMDVFVKKIACDFPDVIIKSLTKLDDVFSLSSFVVLATTSPKPYIIDSCMTDKSEVILNISLRDIAPEIILTSINIVDDEDHVCRENTSIHLAESLVGNRNFIYSTISELTLNEKSLPIYDGRPRIFSPFGLGVLDLALAEYVFNQSLECEVGNQLDDFFPESWSCSSSLS